MKKGLIRKMIPGAVILLIGVLVILLAGSSWLNPPQCPSFQSPGDVDYDCIIGANIGTGIMFMLGTALIVLGGITAFIGSLSALITERKNRQKREDGLTSVYAGRLWPKVILSVVLFFFSLLALIYLFGGIDFLESAFDWADRAMSNTVTSEINFTAVPTTVTQGQEVTLIWSATLMGSPWSPPTFSHCIASSDAGPESQWTGMRETSGTEVVLPTKQPITTYKLDCIENDGSGAGTSVRIKVLPGS